MYYISIIIVIVSNIFYSVFQDSIPNHLNPLVALFFMYIAGMTVAFAFFLKTRKEYHSKLKNHIEWRILAFGLTNIVIDFGFLTAFRENWGLGILNITSNILILIFLTIVGRMWFKEKLSLINVLGIVVGVFGLTLLSI